MRLAQDNDAVHRLDPMGEGVGLAGACPGDDEQCAKGPNHHLARMIEGFRLAGMPE